MERPTSDVIVAIKEKGWKILLDYLNQLDEKEKLPDNVKVIRTIIEFQTGIK